MPIQSASDNQKVDYLWKKIVYGAAKTDISGNIDATNEPVASPLLLRGDKIWQQSDLIANVIPGSNSSVVTVYPTTFPAECTSTAGIPTPTLTWQTGRTFWVPPEFGSTYQIKVYIAPSGNAANVASKGTQVFATGSGSNDLWVFDYQSGVLNFNSNNTPYNGASPISFTGNSVYISGAVYSGNLGLPAQAGLGNIVFSGNTITSSESLGNILLDPTGDGIVKIVGTTALQIPIGNISTRPTDAQQGYIRFNTETDSFEYFNGASWEVPGAATITSAIINPDGINATYTLAANTTAAGILVSINGTLQQPGTAYTVADNLLTFAEVPLQTDVIEVRRISASINSATELIYQFAAVTLDGANVNIKGNLMPFGNTAYSIGSPTVQWKTGYFQTLDAGQITSNLLTAPVVTISGQLRPQSIATNQYYYANGAPVSFGAISGVLNESFETISQNLKAYPYVINYSGSFISNVVYSPAGADIIVKSFYYTGTQLSSLVITGNELGKIYTKNLSYTGTSVSGISYAVS
jgi:hypothetical protein